MENNNHITSVYDYDASNKPEHLKLARLKKIETSRFVYNQCLNYKINEYKTNNKSTNISDTNLRTRMDQRKSFKGFTTIIDQP